MVDQRDVYLARGIEDISQCGVSVTAADRGSNRADNHVEVARVYEPLPLRLTHREVLDQFGRELSEFVDRVTFREEDRDCVPEFVFPAAGNFSIISSIAGLNTVRAISLVTP